jgi:CheY-like chemotaxis protein
VERLLRAHGYLVVSHASGADFLESLHRPPACVVLDLHMPEVDGFAVLEALREDPNGILAIVLTADLSPEAALRASDLGAVACFSKPVASERLLEGIATALQPLRD